RGAGLHRHGRHLRHRRRRDARGAGHRGLPPGRRPHRRGPQRTGVAADGEAMTATLAPTVPTRGPEVRRMRFEWPADLDPDWTPRTPELACVANAVSLLMPHVEPSVVKAV